MSGWEYAHWRRPYIEIYTQPDRVELYLPMFSMIADETLSKLKQMFGEDVISIGKDELTILSFCQIEGKTTNNRLQNNLQRHKVDITQILQYLCKKGYLISENSGRWTTYHLNENFNVDTSNVDTSNTKNPLFDKILVFCREEFKTIKEISTYTYRTEKHLKNRIINKLVKDGKLIRKYSELPNHPEQSYKSTD
jgi:predicted HTH transcriptional regulator